MSSKVNNALFELIRSMTKSEKRYFKLMSSRHTIGGENNYVRLFDFIEKQDQYDEDEIFRHFEGEAFLNRFSITKKRLYDHILSALDSYHSANSVEAQLFTQLHSFDVLFEKSLYDQCRRILRSAEKLAAKHQMHEILLLISGKKKRLLETMGYLKMTEKEIVEVATNDQSSGEIVNDINNIWSMKSQLFSRLSKKGVARSEEEAKVYKEICKDLLDRPVEKGRSFEVDYLIHHVLSAYYYATGQLEQSLLELQANLDHIQSHELGKHLEVNKLISVLTNAIYISDKIGKTKDSLRYLGQLKSLSATVRSNEDLSIKLFSSTSSIELSMFLRKGDFTKAKSIAESVEESLNRYDKKIVPIRRAFLEFKIAVVCIGLGNYNEALSWINRILNDSELDKTEDIIGFTQLLDLLIHIELNHRQLLPYSLKNTQRFFKTRNRLYSFEKVLLQTMSKIIKCEDRFDQQTLWEVMYNELAQITNDDVFESVALDYFDFQSWAESKLKGKAFDRIVREKYNRQFKTAS